MNGPSLGIVAPCHTSTATTTAFPIAKLSGLCGVSYSSNPSGTVASGGGPTIDLTDFPNVPLTGTDALYITSFDLMQKCHEFHLKVWKKTAGIDVTDGMFINRQYDQHPILAFRSKQYRDEFNGWWAAYRTRYNDDLGRHFPELPLHHRLELTIMKSSTLLHADAERVELWAWVINTCAARVWVTFDMLFFESDEDAVAYRLRWH